MARKQKSKPEIKQDIKQIQAATRMREVIRTKVHPLLLELNGTIGFSKVFLQTASTAIDSLFNDKQRSTKIAEFLPKLEEVFHSADKAQQEENDKYLKLFKALETESVYDFNTMIQTMPRVIETYFTQQTDKNSILDLDIDKILGK